MKFKITIIYELDGEELHVKDYDVNGEETDTVFNKGAEIAIKENEYGPGWDNVSITIKRINDY